MQPLYFLAGVTPATLTPGNGQHVRLCRSLLSSRGLADVFADVAEGEYSSFELPGRGPCDRVGTILAYNTPAGQAPRRLGYWPEEQQWTQVGDDLWIGIDPAGPPTPEELRRKRQFDWWQAVLGDGAKYSIPVIRRPDGSTGLPTELYVHPLTGRLEEPIKARYRRYWDESAEVADWFFNGGFDGETSSFTKARALALAVDALSINYRYGPLEQSVLRLVDSENYLTVLSATVDVQGVVAAGQQKKSGDAADLSTLPGPQGV